MPRQKILLLHILNDAASLNLKLCVKNLGRIAIELQKLNFSPTVPYMRNIKGAQ
jgi:hypothetical protein